MNKYLQRQKSTTYGAQWELDTPEFPSQYLSPCMFTDITYATAVLQGQSSLN